ncbi:hypothetical protein ZWY2020_003729 [Hordeum vulgare]|nr:hypothetical protein ZWY2020_003729 [Hordeum vulgare]
MLPYRRLPLPAHLSHPDQRSPPPDPIIASRHVEPQHWPDPPDQGAILSLALTGGRGQGVTRRALLTTTCVGRPRPAPTKGHKAQPHHPYQATPLLGLTPLCPVVASVCDHESRRSRGTSSMASPLTSQSTGSAPLHRPTNGSGGTSPLPVAAFIHYHRSRRSKGTSSMASPMTSQSTGSTTLRRPSHGCGGTTPLYVPSHGCGEAISVILFV